MDVGECDLYGEISLRGTDVHERFVVLPGERARDSQIGVAADARHGAGELLQPRQVRVEGLEHAGARPP
jgi:hypothetical protein